MRVSIQRAWPGDGCWSPWRVRRVPMWIGAHSEHRHLHRLRRDFTWGSGGLARGFRAQIG